MTETVKQFKKVEKEIELLYQKKGDIEAYHKQRDVVVDGLTKLIKLQFESDLNKKQILTLCAWVSRYRPIALHSFLLAIDMRLKINK